MVEFIIRLSNLVDRKFDEDFRHGVIRNPFQFHKIRSGGHPCVWIECPWSVRNSVPGAVYTKSELFFSTDLAEKIIVLEGMP
jgi:hypothetical protein